MTGGAVAEAATTGAAGVDVDDDDDTAATAAAGAVVPGAVFGSADFDFCFWEVNCGLLVGWNRRDDAGCDQSEKENEHAR